MWVKPAAVWVFGSALAGLIAAVFLQQIFIRDFMQRYRPPVGGYMVCKPTAHPHLYFCSNIPENHEIVISRAPRRP